MAILHTVNKSPFDKNSLDACLRLALAGSSVLFIEDGVYGAMKGTEKSAAVENATGDISFYVLGPDLKARGIGEDKLINGVKVVGYDEFVSLTVDNDKVQAWL